MLNFSIPTIKIKSSWFEGKEHSIFQKMGKEEGLNLYLQLFRFRVHQGDINEHYFNLSIGSLLPYTKVNYKRRLTNSKIFEFLKTLGKLNIVELLNYKSWDSLLENGRVLADKFIQLKAIDVPIITQDTNSKNKTVESPKTSNDYYISVKFKEVSNIYDCGLDAKHLAVYFLIKKLSISIEKKAWINIKRIASWLGYGDKTVADIIVHLNEARMIVTSIKKLPDGRETFEHRLYKMLAEDDERTRKRFLSRYSKKGDDVLEIEEDWGEDPQICMTNEEYQSYISMINEMEQIQT